jgi:hypothetical protein
MGKRILFVVFLLVLVFALSGVAFAWEGRMGGMEDPYGLVQDESDYLIHPAKIANGQGVTFYGDYRFTYTGVPKWDGLGTAIGQEDISGQEIGNNALVGVAFPMGPGRMGIFFTYDGMRGKYSQDDTNGGDKLNNDLDNFAVKVMYGLPVGGGFKLGAEAELAYRNEQQEIPSNGNGPILFYQYPNDSHYLEALFKGSLEKKIGPLDVEFTLRGGIDLPGTNSTDWNASPGTGASIKASGEVHGWQVGSDLWLRYALAQDLTLPFLVRADYLQRPRSGFGPFIGGPYSAVDFQGEVRDLAITIGGGVDKEISKATRIAAGIYYNFLQEKEDFTFSFIGPVSLSEAFTYPDSMEHQLLLRLVAEHALSSTVTLRAGLNLFYGWVIPESTGTLSESTGTFLAYHEDPGHGYDWGIMVSLGGTVVIKPLTFEPFVGGGYRQFHVGMSGTFLDGPPLVTAPSADTTSRNEWLVTSGLSILFDL